MGGKEGDDVALSAEETAEKKRIEEVVLSYRQLYLEFIAVGEIMKKANNTASD
jgi:hypothetical protein